MFVCEYDFPVEREHRDTAENLLHELVGNWHNSGLLWGEDFFVWVDGRFRVFCQLPTKDALEYADARARATLGQLAALTSAPTEPTITGSRSGCNDAAHQQQLYLFSTFIDKRSPLHCTLGSSIPLYRLPLSFELREQLVQRWMATHAALDSLQLQSGPLEREAYRELADVDSAFMQHSRKLADSIEQSTTIPTYCYVFRYWATALTMMQANGSQPGTSSIARAPAAAAPGGSRKTQTDRHSSTTAATHAAWYLMKPHRTITTIWLHSVLRLRD